MKYYKLTDKQNQTQGETQWGEGVTHKAKGRGKELCCGDVIHVYDNPYKAVLFNPIHANFALYNLWECKVKKVVANDGLKVGVKECTTIEIVDTPKITITQRVAFAIYCALEVHKGKKYIKWAGDWLSGKDRTYAAARAARAARAAVVYAAAAAYAADVYAADAAARAAAVYTYAKGAKINFSNIIKKALKVK